MKTSLVALIARIGLFSTLALAHTSPSVATTLQSFHSIGSIRHDVATKVATFSDGTFVVVGTIHGEANFGTETHPVRLSPFGEQNLFITKYSAKGEPLWTKLQGETGEDKPTGLAAFADGTFAVSGTFHGVTVLGHGEPGETTLKSFAGNGVSHFVARFRADGQLSWAKVTGQADYFTASSGSFEMGGTQAGELLLASAYKSGEKDAFSIQKLDRSGKTIWEKRLGSPDYLQAYPRGIASLADGSVLVTGYFRYTVRFGEGEPTQTDLTPQTSIYDFDLFVARFDRDGKFVWVKDLPHMTKSRVVPLRDGGFALGGIFGDERDGVLQVVLGKGDAKEVTVTCNSNFYSLIGMVARYDKSGQISWVTPGCPAAGNLLGLAAFDQVTVAPDETVRILGGGYLNMTLPTTGAPTLLAYDVHLFEFNASDGSLKQSSITAVRGTQISAVANRADGSMVAVGSHECLTFDSDSDHATTYPSVGGKDAWIGLFK